MRTFIFLLLFPLCSAAQLPVVVSDLLYNHITDRSVTSWVNRSEIFRHKFKELTYYYKRPYHSTENDSTGKTFYCSQYVSVVSCEYFDSLGFPNRFSYLPQTVELLNPSPGSTPYFFLGDSLAKYTAFINPEKRHIVFKYFLEASLKSPSKIRWITWNEDGTVCRDSTYYIGVLGCESSKTCNIYTYTEDGRILTERRIQYDFDNNEIIQTYVLEWKYNTEGSPTEIHLNGETLSRYIYNNGKLQSILFVPRESLHCIKIEVSY